MNIKKKSIIYFLGLIIMIGNFIPTFTFLLRGSVGIIPITIIFLGLTIDKGNMIYIIQAMKMRKNFYLVIFFFIVGILIEKILNKGIGQATIILVVIRMILLILFHDVMKRKYKEIYKRIFLITMKLMIVMFIISFIYAVKNENIVKIMTGGITGSTDKEYILGSLLGLSDSVYYMGLSIFNIIIINRITEKKILINKYIDIAFIIGASLNIFISASLTAIAILIGGTLIVMLTRISMLKIIKNIMILVLVISCLLGIGRIFEKEIAVKIIVQRIEKILSSNNKVNDKSFDERKLFNEVSVKTFNENIIFGNGSGFGKVNDRIINERGIGGHSSLVDILAMYGILGGIIWIIIVFELLKTKNKEVRIKMIIGSIILLASYLNPVITNISFVIFIFNGMNITEILEGN